MLDTLRGFWLRLGRWPRLLAAAACLLLALLSALQSRAASADPHAGNTVAVVVASRSIAAGALVGENDVGVQRWPRRLRPARAFARTHDVVGHRVAGPLARGEPLTPARLVGAGLTSGLPPGTGAVAVSVATSVLALVHPGDRVDLYAGDTTDDIVDATVSGGSSDTSSSGTSSSATSSSGARSDRLVASDVRVLAALRGGDVSSPTLIVAADRVTAVRVADRGALSVFTVVARNP